MSRCNKKGTFRRLIDWIDRYTKKEFSKIIKPKCSHDSITLILKEHDKISPNYNEIIHEYVKKHRITYGQLAYRIGINYATLSTYMNDSRKPHPKTLLKIKQFFKDKR